MAAALSSPLPASKRGLVIIVGFSTAAALSRPERESLEDKDISDYLNISCRNLYMIDIIYKVRIWNNVLSVY